MPSSSKIDVYLYMYVCMYVCGSKIHTCTFVNQIAQIETSQKGFGENKRHFVCITRHYYGVCSTIIFLKQQYFKCMTGRGDLFTLNELPK